MTAPTPGPFRAQLDAAVAAVGLQVNRETVLQARSVLLAEADRLDDHLARAWGMDGGIGSCGGDPVSPEAAAAFNERISALIQSCRSYNRDLRKAAAALDATARKYGYTDEDIVNSFRMDP